MAEPPSPEALAEGAIARAYLAVHKPGLVAGFRLRSTLGVREF